MFRGACGPAAAVCAVLLAASPASADATVSPTTAEQGGGVSLTLTVRNDHQKAALTKVRLVLPPASPMAEVYPLSVPNWAPRMTVRKLNPPLQNPHGGGLVTQTTADIVWTAVAGKAIPPGGEAGLMVAMGPLPQSAQLQLTLEPTYADGSTGPALSPLTLTLNPPPPPVDGAGPIVATDEPGAGPGRIAGWIAAVLSAALGLLALLRYRRARLHAEPPESTDGTPAFSPAVPSKDAGPAGAAAPAKDASDSAGTDADWAPDADPGPQSTAGAPAAATTGDGAEAIPEPRTRVTAWSYRDGP